MAVTMDQLMKITNGYNRWIIYDGDERIFLGWRWELCDKLVEDKAREGELYKKIKDRDVKKFCFHTDINHKRWQELGLMSPLMPGDEAQFSYSDLQETIFYEVHL